MEQVIPSSDEFLPVLFMAKKQNPSFGRKRLAKFLQLTYPHWKVTEKRVGRLLKKYNLTITSGQKKPVPRPGLMSRQGLCILRERDEFGRCIEASQFFKTLPTVAALADDLAWMVTHPNESHWLPILVRHSDELFDSTDGLKALRAAREHFQASNPHLAQQCYHAQLLLAATARDGVYHHSNKPSAHDDLMAKMRTQHGGSSSRDESTAAVEVRKNHAKRRELKKKMAETKADLNANNAVVGVGKASKQDGDGDATPAVPTDAPKASAGSVHARDSFADPELDLPVD
ncbi:MRP-1 protein [Thecamonas trahens ATCC 50062]|uniref:MRP-1 protein n=1 Tax=Thecamonas trahens ATCC 50062 TaxID=461836 RepID=A0A0L0DJJ2_THETB|nr:MRP-1 protein [Thecamonas trahens ATCC 50062]KNC52271.1 MRP-1 protein [Thecamonas trahens ATCC 50062]|eukprot:XP_013762270.1 MRP-1 protein [Thecamonas trahens ATCC 50062]